MTQSEVLDELPTHAQRRTLSRRYSPTSEHLRRANVVTVTPLGVHRPEVLEGIRRRQGICSEIFEQLRTCYAARRRDHTYLWCASLSPSALVEDAPVVTCSDEDLAVQVTHQARRNFRASGPLAAVTYVITSAGTAQLITVSDHLISDGFSHGLWVAGLLSDMAVERHRSTSIPFSTWASALAAKESPLRDYVRRRVDARASSYAPLGSPLSLPGSGSIVRGEARMVVHRSVAFTRGQLSAACQERRASPFMLIAIGTGDAAIAMAGQDQVSMLFSSANRTSRAAATVFGPLATTGTYIHRRGSWTEKRRALQESVEDAWIPLRNDAVEDELFRHDTILFVGVRHGDKSLGDTTEDWHLPLTLDRRAIGGYAVDLVLGAHEAWVEIGVPEGHGDVATVQAFLSAIVSRIVAR